MEFIRLNPDGSVQERDLPVNFAAAIDEASNPSLRNEDVIVVRRSGLSTFEESNQVFSPLGGIFSVLRAIFGRW